MSDQDRFRLGSGERQVNETLAGIRRDHRARYELMIECVRRHRRDSKSGADIFCGTGYGTQLLASQLDCCMIGVDASVEAIRFAESYYSSDSTFFSAKRFPFSLPPNVFDFVCLLESVEHVEDGQALIDTVFTALRPGGLLLVSTPNAERFDLARNPNPFHCRHYTPSAVNELLRSFTVLERWHQNVYSMDASGVITAIRPEEEQGVSAGPDGQFMISLARKPRRQVWFWPGKA
jgi:SAM-dependent methyltransferase